MESNNDYSSKVDTSRPFRSVKEAVAVFGERLLLGEIYNPPRNDKQQAIIASWKYYSPSPPRTTHHHNDSSEFYLKKLETELEETKMELKLLKKRESETEIALATLNAELHKNMSKLAEAEAVAAKNAVAEDEKMRDLMMMRRMVDTSPTLAHILSIGEGNMKSNTMMNMNMKKKKKKPIVPLVTDFFCFKTKSSSHENPLYASSRMYFN